MSCVRALTCDRIRVTEDLVVQIRKQLGEYWEGMIKYAPVEFQRYEVGECDTETLPEASRPLMQDKEVSHPCISISSVQKCK